MVKRIYIVYIEPFLFDAIAFLKCQTKTPQKHGYFRQILGILESHSQTDVQIKKNYFTQVFKVPGLKNFQSIGPLGRCFL